MEGLGEKPEMKGVLLESSPDTEEHVHPSMASCITAFPGLLLMAQDTQMLQCSCSQAQTAQNSVTELERSWVLGHEVFLTRMAAYRKRHKKTQVIGGKDKKKELLSCQEESGHAPSPSPTQASLCLCKLPITILPHKFSEGQLEPWKQPVS